jgi:hypothetical protein
VISAPFGFFEVEREPVGALPGWPTFGKAPERFNAVDMVLAAQIRFSVMDLMMFEPVPSSVRHTLSSRR